jgi:diguanylate cyclase (GGDEF)-like protein
MPTTSRMLRMRRISIALVLFIISTGVSTLPAQLLLDSASGIGEAINGSDVLRDPSGRWTLDDVLRRSSAFVPAASLVPDLRSSALRPSTLWYRLQPRSTGTGPWYLHTTYDVDRGEMFFVRPPGPVVRTRFGTLLPYARRQLPTYENVFELPAEATRGGTIYLRLVVRRDIFGGYSIRPAGWSATVGRALSENRLLPALVIVGMLAALALFNAILGITLREKNYYWYAAATGCFALYECIASGGAWRWLWPYLSVPFDGAAYAAYLAYFAMTIVFARHFLDLPATQGRLWRAIVAIYVVSAILDVLNVFAPNLSDGSIIAGYFDAITSGPLLCAMFCSGVVAWRRGAFGAVAYTLAFAGVVIGLMIGTLGYNVLIPETGWTDAAPGLGVAWEAIFLALALAQRIRRLRGERDAALVEARVDALTGIPNRRAFDRRMNDEWRLALRGGTPLALVLIDVDLFKSYNDLYGHQAGDRTLTLVAATIERSLRRADDFVARYGGEEFVVILPYCDLADAVAVADIVRAAISSLDIVHPPNGRLSISAGVAGTIPRSETTAEQLIAAADRALYAAKTAGRNRVEVRAALVA